MASEAQLRARIEEISSAIELQKRVLRDLEKNKSDVQGRLNAILDPMARLPLELSSDIFLQCVPDDPVPREKVAPMLLLRVCRAWSHIALSTTLLWAAIYVRSPRHKDFPQLMERWIFRAGTRLLRILIHDEPNGAIRELVQKNAHRVETLTLSLPSGRELKDITTLLPSLSVLTIEQGPYDDSDEDSDDGEYHYSNDPTECVQMLAVAPNLVECTFTAISYRSDLDTDHIPTIHARLTHLRVDGGWGTNCTSILSCVTLPALESLSIVHCETKHDQLIRFLTRSAPPLRSLYLRVPNEWLTDTGSALLKEFCVLAPNLAELELHVGQLGELAAINFLNVVAERDFFRILRTLTIEGFDPTRPIYKIALNFLTSRRSRLTCFRLTFPGYGPAPTPDADLVVALRELVAEGMQIHIGPYDHNYSV